MTDPRHTRDVRVLFRLVTLVIADFRDPVHLHLPASTAIAANVAGCIATLLKVPKVLETDYGLPG
jgi:hypothetical protein